MYIYIHILTVYVYIWTYIYTYIYIICVYIHIYCVYANYKDIKDICKPDHIGWNTSYSWSSSRMYSPYGPVLVRLEATKRIQKASTWLKSSILLVTYFLYIILYICTFIYLFRSKSIYAFNYIYICHGIFQIVGKFYPQFVHTCQQATMDKNWWISPSKMIHLGVAIVSILVSKPS
jgi:hypothetical protein